MASSLPGSAGSAPAATSAGGGRTSPADPEATLVSARPPTPARMSSVAEIGRTLEGRFLGPYRLDRFIGGGGMGAVFRALDTTLDRVVAVKVLSRQQSNDDEMLRRFRNEAQSAARLDHENIGRVHAVGSDDGWHYIVFEFIEGTNLRDIVAQEGPFDVGRTIDVTIQVAEALEHASQRAVVHRDIKPSNIIITPAGRARVVDMGLARLHQVAGDHDLTVSGMTLGTFDYISPEQARDPRSADVRSDLYSLGCTMFYMLAGRPPFAEGTMVQKLLQHQQDPPPAIEAMRPDVPRRVVAILRRLMEKKPRDRYQRPAELVADLVAAADELGIELATPRTVTAAPSAAPAARRPGVRLPWIVPLVGLAAVVGGLWLRSAGRHRTINVPVPPTRPAEADGEGEPDEAAMLIPERVWRVVDTPANDDDCGTLGEALRQAADGDVIEIASADPRDDGPYVVEGKRIIIRAAEDVQPVIRFIEPPASDRPDAGCLTVVSGTLELDGVTLRPAFLHSGGTRPAVVALEGAAMVHCQRVAFALPADPTAAIVGIRALPGPGDRQEIHLHDVHSAGGTVFFEAGMVGAGIAVADEAGGTAARRSARQAAVSSEDRAAGGRIDVFLAGGRVICPGRFLLAQGGRPEDGGVGIRMTLEDGSFACADGFACLIDSASQPKSPRLQAFAKACVFAVPEGRPFLEQSGIGDPEGYRPAIEWSDAASRYEGTSVFRRIDGAAERVETDFGSLPLDHGSRIEPPPGDGWRFRGR